MIDAILAGVNRSRRHTTIKLRSSHDSLSSASNPAPYLLPSIAAVVIGGTNILGGRGRYLGTLVGVILIVLLNSVLSIMEMPEAGRQVIYGGVIILMLLVYGRGERVTS